MCVKQIYTVWNQNNPQTIQSTLTTRYFTSTSLSAGFNGAYETASDGTWKKYFTFAGQTIAMKDANGLKYFLTDHLGSISAVLNSSGNVLSQQRYLPFGEIRPDVGSITQTDFGYTGQRNINGLGLMDYKARFYSPYITHFSQPDTVIPQPYNPQSWNRYSYALNNPVRYNDPSGHTSCVGKNFDDGPQCLKRFDNAQTKGWNDYAKWARAGSKNPNGWPNEWWVLSTRKAYLEAVAAGNIGPVKGSRDAGPNSGGVYQTSRDAVNYILGNQTEAFLGSYTITIGPVDVNNPSYVKISIRNVTGMDSGTRLSKYFGETGFGPYISGDEEYQWAEEHQNGYPMIENIYWYETLSP